MLVKIALFYYLLQSCLINEIIQVILSFFILIMDEMAAILRGWLHQMREGYGLYFIASSPGLILNQFRIYNRWHIQ